MKNQIIKSMRPSNVEECSGAGSDNTAQAVAETLAAGLHLTNCMSRIGITIFTGKRTRKDCVPVHWCTHGLLVIDLNGGIGGPASASKQQGKAKEAGAKSLHSVG